MQVTAPKRALPPPIAPVSSPEPRAAPVIGIARTGQAVADCLEVGSGQILSNAASFAASMVE